ncbi:lipid II flippase MurJ [Streptosporangium sp. NPDC023615]|uniref:murein biosynthesis integral membrane protein MurJ n=1 Tax=Streptosporangium sp. NPDC023615 TaxID=3154794 RepID=UPI00342D3A27
MTRRIGQSVAGAALLIGVVTVVARLVGFGRYFVQSESVGNGCLSTAYNTANYVPNIVFELVAGGALAGMVVPVLASAASRADQDPRARAETGRTTSALLTWTMLVLVPVALLIVAFARPIVALLAGSAPGCDVAQVVEVGTGMLVLFAPRMIFFGLAVVLYGVLQAHRRFLGPALAPLVSSLLIIASNLLFEAVNGPAATHLSDLDDAGALTLSLGATVAAAAMVATVVGPVARLRLRLRPSLSFPPGVAARARGLATAGLAVLVAQQITLIVVVQLANDLGGKGAVGVYTYAWALYQLPYAVLVMPIATSSFPVLSTRAEAGDLAGFDALTSATTRAVLLVTGLAAGVMAAVAVPVARVFLEDTPGGDPAEMARAVALFAPGLAGYALMLHLARILYARGLGRPAAVASVAGWGVALVAQIVLANAARDETEVVGRLALGSTIGMTVGGLLLALAVFRAGGARALAGAPRALLTALAGGAAAWGAGLAVVGAFGEVSRWMCVPVGVAAAVAGTAAFAVVAVLVGGPDTRGLPGRLRGRAGRAGEEGSGSDAPSGEGNGSDERSAEGSGSGGRSAKGSGSDE